MRDVAVPLLFFLSGAAGLIFQVVWFHRCGLVFGNTVWATSIVLASFMAGLAIGNGLIARFGHRIARPLRAYAALELVIGVTGIVLTYALPSLAAAVAPLSATAMDQPWVGNLVRLSTAFVVLLIPATAMGATLPLVVQALSGSHRRFGEVLGRLYGWNTLGAVVGVLGAEVLLVSYAGVIRSAWAAGLLNVFVAAVAFCLPRVIREGRASEVIFAPVSVSNASWRFLVCAFVTGGCLLALEVIWFRFLSMFVITSTLTVSLMLAAVLTGIAIGGFAAATWLRRHPDAVDYLPAVLLAAGGVLVGSYAAFQWVTDGSLVRAWQRILWFTIVLTLPASFLSGAIFTLIGEALKSEFVYVTRTAGWLTLANTAGAMCGSLVAAFMLLPVIGMERAFLVVAAAYGATSFLVIRKTHLRGTWGTAGSARPVWAFRVAAISLVAAAALFPYGMMERTYFARSAEPYTSDGSQIVAVREGAAETILLLQQSWQGEPIYHRLLTNGFSMTGTAVTGKRYMRYFGYLPMMLHREPIRRVLVVGYGLGVTTGAVTDIESAESIDVVEISRDVVSMSDVVYADGAHPLKDPRIRLHFEDGRQFLQTTDQQFDLITGEPPPPLTPGTVNLYTREYFQLVRDCLAEGGIATYWLPVARQEQTDLASVIKAFCAVFDDCSMWNSTPADLMLVGTRHASGPVSESTFVRPWTLPRLKARLSEAGFETPEQIGATFVADAPRLREFTASVSPLTDDYPRRLRLPFTRLSPSDPRELLDRGGAEYVHAVLDTDQARRAFEASDFIRRLWPAALRAETLRYFDAQRIINRVLLEGANPLRQIEDLHYVLTRTRLERLPLWILGLGNHPIQAAADRMRDDGSGQTAYVRGLRALAARDYVAAAEELSHAQRRGLAGTTPLLAYALGLAGRPDLAAQLAHGAKPTNPDAQHFWQWIQTTFAPRFVAGNP